MNEKTIWKFLYSKIKNPYGVAAVMGNLMAESSMNPAKTTGAKAGAPTYVQDADSGKIDFVHDGVAFGLVQWCYWSRKQALYDLAKKQQKSVGDLNVQLEYLWQEIQTYKTVINAVKNATNIREASDVVMLKYEKPAGKTESAKQKRADYGQKFFDQFADEASKEAFPRNAVIAKTSVNLRSGDGISFAKLGSVAAGTRLEWVATAENGWHAVRWNNKVVWISGEYTRREGNA